MAGFCRWEPFAWSMVFYNSSNHDTQQRCRSCHRSAGRYLRTTIMLSLLNHFNLLNYSIDDADPGELRLGEHCLKRDTKKIRQKNATELRIQHMNMDQYGSSIWICHLQHDNCWQAGDPGPTTRDTNCRLVIGGILGDDKDTARPSLASNLVSGLHKTTTLFSDSGEPAACSSRCQVCPRISATTGRSGKETPWGFAGRSQWLGGHHSW